MKNRIFHKKPKMNGRVQKMVKEIQKLYDQRKNLTTYSIEQLNHRLQEIHFQQARLDALWRLPETPLDLQMSISKVASDLEEVEEETRQYIHDLEGNHEK